MAQFLASQTSRLPRSLRRSAFAISFLGLLAPAASACPSCSVGQAIETLALIMAFMAIPYIVATGVWIWMRRLFAGERLDS